MKLAVRLLRRRLEVELSDSFQVDGAREERWEAEEWKKEGWMMRCTNFGGGRKNEGRIEACCGGAAQCLQFYWEGSQHPKFITTFTCANAASRAIFIFASFI